MKNPLNFSRVMMALVAAGAVLATAGCEPDNSAASGTYYNPQIDGLVYQQPAQPDLSYLGDQKTLHPASIRSMVAPSAPAAAAASAPAAAPATAAAPSPESAPESATPAPASPAPASPAPAAPTTDAPVAPPN